MRVYMFPRPSGRSSRSLWGGAAVVGKSLRADPRPSPRLPSATLYRASTSHSRHSGHSPNMVAWIPLFTLPERLHTPGRTPPRRPTTHISTMPAIVLSFSLGHRWTWPLEPLVTLPERRLQHTHHSEHRLAVPQLPSASRATVLTRSLCCTAACVLEKSPGHVGHQHIPRAHSRMVISTLLWCITLPGRRHAHASQSIEPNRPTSHNASSH